MDQAESLRKKAKERQNQMERQDERVNYVEGNPVLVLAITSGKGGVGKTNICANLGIALARLGKRVLIFDTDLGLANIDILLGLNPEFNISHVFTGEKRLEEVIVDGPEGLQILPASSGIEEVTALSEAARMDLLAQFENMDRQIDIMLLDTGAGIGSNVMYFNVSAQHILIVTTAEPTAITDAYAMMKILSTKYQEKRFQLLVNMIADEKEALGVYRHLSQVANRFLDISINFFGYIPRDPHIPASVKQQKAVLDAYPNAPSSKLFESLASSILSMEIPRSPKGNIQFLWRHVLRVG